ncbi:cysteine proteinase EP-B 2-like [Aegilops tauschii subsp. strangulata]|nr:cysteine proteinase EP-B 2-like [Aegilops tauschii subsp. strangulata]XP_044401973.1 cysteine proteinase EP-B 2-like [Triticum aestivum]
MVSMLWRASRDLARAARTIASAGRWAPPVTVARSAPSDLSGRLSFHSGIDTNTPRSTYAAPDELASSPSCTPHPDPGTDEVILPSDKDLESEEALWALYKRWCKSFNEERDYDEMVRRFDTFKDSVRMVDSVNKANLPYTLKLSQFADGKLAEYVVPKVFDEQRYRPDSATSVKGEAFIYAGEDDVPEHPQMRFKFSESGGPIIPLE